MIFMQNFPYTSHMFMQQKAEENCYLPVYIMYIMV